MKRYSYLFDDIVSMDNLRLAHKNASRGKKKYEEVIEVDKDVDKYCKMIQDMLVNNLYPLNLTQATMAG